MSSEDCASRRKDKRQKKYQEDIAGVKMEHVHLGVVVTKKIYRAQQDVHVVEIVRGVIWVKQTRVLKLF